MGFPRDQVDELLKACHRRCCICHRFCGVKIETDHIEPAAEEGTDSIDNAIPVCFECHAEIHSYNDRHPRGRKFRPEELRRHKEQWLEICRNRPEVLLNVIRDSDVGPLQGLIDELEFNVHVAKHASPSDLGCPFLDEQFRRAIREGAVATLNDELKLLILEAYRATSRANQLIPRALSQGRTSILYSEYMGWAQEAINHAKPKVGEAWSALLQFLRSER